MEELGKHQERLQSAMVSIQNEYTLRLTYLHRTIVNAYTIELNKGIVGTARLAEGNQCYAAAYTIWTVCNGSTLDWTNSFAKVFLYRRILHRVSIFVFLVYRVSFQGLFRGRCMYWAITRINTGPATVHPERAPASEQRALVR